MSDVMGAKKRQTLSKKQLDQKILRANKKLALKRENIKSDIKKKESLIKSLDDDISVSRSSINVLNREFKDIEDKFDREKARISKEKARVSDLEKVSDKLISNNLSLRDENNCLEKSIADNNKKLRILESSLLKIKSEKKAVEDSIEDLDYIDNQKELIKKEINDLNIEKRRIDDDNSKTRSKIQRDIDRFKKSADKTFEDSRRLDEEHMAIKKTVEVAEQSYNVLSKRLKESIEEKQLEVDAMNSLVKDKETEFIRMNEKYEDTKSKLEDEKFKIKRVKKSFEEWKISALEGVARLKLKKKIDNIDKAGLKELLNAE